MGITVELSISIGRWGSLLNCLLLLGYGKSLLNCLLLLGNGNHCLIVYCYWKMGITVELSTALGDEDHCLNV
jgi:hypothetical protein